MIRSTLQTCNEAWGLDGTAAHSTDPGLAWHLSFKAVAKATGGDAEGVRSVLASRLIRLHAIINDNVICAKAWDRARH